MFEFGCRAIYEKSIEEAIRLAKRGRFKVLEIHLSSPQFSPEKYSRDQLQTLKLYAQKMGVVLQVHGSLETSLIYTNTDLRAGGKRQLDQIISFCSVLGARCLTLHPGQAAIYHTADGKKLKGDKVYARYYESIFEDSIKYLESIARKGLYICVENTDNFTSGYRKILARHLKTGKIFLTCDIRKVFSYTTSELITDQLNFFVANSQYVKNLHISGLGAAHSGIKGWEKKFKPFFGLFGGRDLPLIIEIMPEKETIAAKKVLERLSHKFSIK
jgi:sugar phosphate isomerase/epimerase